MIATRRTGARAYDDLLGRLSVVGLVAAVCGLALQQALEPQLSPVSDAISAYEVGSYAYLQTMALGVMGAGSLVLAVMLGSGTRSLAVRCGSALVATWGVGIALLGIVNINDGPLPTSGGVHEIIATLAFGAAVGAIVYVSSSYARQQVWSATTAIAWSFGGLTLGALTLALEDSSFFGLTERALGLTIVCWLVVITKTPVAARVLQFPDIPPLDVVRCEASAA